MGNFPKKFIIFVQKKKKYLTPSLINRVDISNTPSLGYTPRRFFLSGISNRPNPLINNVFYKC